MLERGKMERGIFEIVDTESLVPEGHLLRKIDEAVDFNKIYDMVEPLYCADNGRPSVDPVVLFKMVLIQHLYGLGSLRRTAEEVRANIYYRWFLGYRLQEDTPHFTTISYNFRHRFTSETVDQIFSWILMEMVEAGYVAPGVVFVDGTHIKANANTKKVVKKEVPVAAKRYAEELMEEVNADREAHGKKPFEDDSDEDDNSNEPPTPPKKKRDNTSKKKLKKRKKEGKKKTVTVSTTDPDCGLFVKGDHKKQLAYEAHTACDVRGVVLAVEVTPGNVHDSVVFDDVYDNVVEQFPDVHAFVADSAYKTPHICKKVFSDGRVLSTAYKRPQTMKGGHEWWKYVYDEYFDCIICPEYESPLIIPNTAPEATITGKKAIVRAISLPLKFCTSISAIKILNAITNKRSLNTVPTVFIIVTVKSGSLTNKYLKFPKPIFSYTIPLSPGETFDTLNLMDTNIGAKKNVIKPIIHGIANANPIHFFFVSYFNFFITFLR